MKEGDREIEREGETPDKSNRHNYLSLGGVAPAFMNDDGFDDDND